LAQAIGCVGWQKLVKSFFFFFLPWRLVHSSSKQAYQTGADSVVLLVKSFVSIGSIFRDNHGFDA